MYLARLLFQALKGSQINQHSNPPFIGVQANSQTPCYVTNRPIVLQALFGLLLIGIHLWKSVMGRSEHMKGLSVSYRLCKRHPFLNALGIWVFAIARHHLMTPDVDTVERCCFFQDLDVFLWLMLLISILVLIFQRGGLWCLLVENSVASFHHNACVTG